MEPTRINFLKGFAALAAVAVSPVSFQALGQTDREKLVAMMKSGRVTGQTFIFHDRGSVVLENMNGLVIEDCRFIWKNGLIEGESILYIKDSKNYTIKNCHFDAKPPAP